MSMRPCEHRLMKHKQDLNGVLRNPTHLINKSSESNNRDPRHSLSERKGRSPTDRSLVPCRSRFKSSGALSFRTRTPKHAPAIIAFGHALRIQSAEFWLRLGEPLEALAEIEALPQHLRRNSRVHQLQMGATSAAKLFQAAP